MSDAGWHYQHDGEMKGPFTDDQLKALCEVRAINAGTQVWKQSFGSWKALGDTDFIYKSSLAPPAMQPAAAAGVSQKVGSVAGAPVGNLSLWQTYYQTLTERYSQFQGRSSRKEYWSFLLFFYVFFIPLGVIGFLLDDASGNLRRGHAPMLLLLVGPYALAFFVPFWAVAIRRVHDFGMSGWLMLLACIPYLGVIPLVVFGCIPSQAVDNKHGPVPR